MSEQVFKCFHVYMPEFCNRLFNAFDTNWDGQLDLTEWMGAMFAFCAADRAGLEMLAFELYDDGRWWTENGSVARRAPPLMQPELPARASSWHTHTHHYLLCCQMGTA